MPGLNNQVDIEEDLPNDFSDGDRSVWPGSPYRRSDDSKYRSTLAKDWFDTQGLGVKGFNRSYKRLPANYALLEMPKPDGSSTVYKRLFGHPSKRFFDSTKTFFPHFKWLMGGGSGHCSCKLCGKGELAERTEFKPRPRHTDLIAQQARNTPRNTPPEIVYGRIRSRTEERVPVDEEGTPDPYKPLVQKLVQRGNRVLESIREEQSMDWRAEREILPKTLGRISLQHSFLPRVGELVLWTSEMKGDLILNEETGKYELYSFDAHKYLGIPYWMAGTVTEVPDEPGDFQDLVENPAKDTAVNISGYRIEAFPDPNNSTNKNLSKHYRYVPLRQIRPLPFWQLLLRGLEEDILHPSVKNALTMFSSVSLVEKFKFRGEGSEAEIFCKGIYLGPELLIVGDAVRILPENGGTNCTDILVITSIRLHLHDLSSANVHESSALAPRTSIHLYGHGYTTTGIRSYAKEAVDGRPLNPTEISTLFPLVGVSALGSLYRLHSPSNRMEVSYDRILGRLHEPSATCLWLNLSVSSTPASTIMSYDVPAVDAGRLYSQQTDARIPEGRSWFVADIRAQALALETFNGREVGVYDDAVRNEKAMRAWRANLRVLDGNATEQDLEETVVTPSTEGKKRGRKPGGRVVGGRVIYPGQPGYEEAVSGGAKTETGPIISKMVEAAMEGSSDDDDEGDDNNDDDDDDSDPMEGVTSGIQKSIEKSEPAFRVRMIEDDEDEENEESESSEEEPLPPHVERGGTEESEGGDYTPILDSFTGGTRPERRAKY